MKRGNKITMQLDQSDLPKRFGLSKRIVKFLRITSVILGVPLMTLGAILAIVGFSTQTNDMAVVGLAFFLLPPILRDIENLNYRFIEVKEKGIGQGKKFISWGNIAQIVRTKGFNEEVIHIQGEDGTSIAVVSARVLKIPLDTLVAFWVQKARLIERKGVEDVGIPSETRRWKERITKVWAREDYLGRGFVLEKKSKGREKPDKNIFGRLNPENWSVTAWRIFGGFVLFADCVLIATVIALVLLQGPEGVEIHRSGVEVLAAFTLLLDFLFIWLILVDENRGWIKSFFLALVFFIILILLFTMGNAIIGSLLP